MSLQPLRIGVDVEDMAKRLMPEANSNAALNRIYHALTYHEADHKLEEFIASALKLLATENDQLRETVIRMAMESNKPLIFAQKLTPTRKG